MISVFIPEADAQLPYGVKTKDNGDLRCCVRQEVQFMFVMILK